MTHLADCEDQEQDSDCESFGGHDSQCDQKRGHHSELVHHWDHGKAHSFQEVVAERSSFWKIGSIVFIIICKFKICYIFHKVIVGLNLFTITKLKYYVL